MARGVKDVRFVIGAAQWDQLPTDGRPEVAFIGRSNVGKSSLLNALVGRKNLARTSSTPGKTRQFNYYLVDNRFYLVDLPGLGYARISARERNRWAQLIHRYLTTRPVLKLVFHLIDSRHPPQPVDERIMEMMKGSDIPYVVVLTKVDKLSQGEQQKAIRRVEETLRKHHLEVPIVQTSAHKKQGIKELWDWMTSMGVRS